MQGEKAMDIPGRTPSRRSGLQASPQPSDESNGRDCNNCENQKGYTESTFGENTDGRVGCSDPTLSMIVVCWRL